MISDRSSYWFTLHNTKILKYLKRKDLRLCSKICSIYSLWAHKFDKQKMYVFSKQFLQNGVYDLSNGKVRKQFRKMKEVIILHVLSFTIVLQLIYFKQSKVTFYLFNFKSHSTFESHKQNYFSESKSKELLYT